MAAMILKEIDRPTLALLGKLDQLTALTLGDWVTDARLEELPPVLTHLQYLSVRAPLVRDRGVATLCRWRALKSLSLDQVSVTDKGLAPASPLDRTRDPGANGNADHRCRSPALALPAEIAGDRPRRESAQGLRAGATRRPEEPQNARGARRSRFRPRGRLSQTTEGAPAAPAAADKHYGRRGRRTAAGISRDEIIGGSLAASQKNMSRLGLALHEYHSQHGHFPPAVLTGPDGKTSYSWRMPCFLCWAGTIFTRSTVRISRGTARPIAKFWSRCPMSTDHRTGRLTVTRQRTLP